MICTWKARWFTPKRWQTGLPHHTGISSWFLSRFFFRLVRREYSSGAVMVIPSGKSATAEEPLREIAKDESGAVLWDRPYQFKRLSAAGDYLVEKGENGIAYTVVSSKLEGNLVLTVLRATWNMRAQEGGMDNLVARLQSRALANPKGGERVD